MQMHAKGTCVGQCTHQGLVEIFSNFKDKNHCVISYTLSLVAVEAIMESKFLDGEGNPRTPPLSLYETKEGRNAEKSLLLSCTFSPNNSTVCQ